jgi:hypothetical protein
VTTRVLESRLILVDGSVRHQLRLHHGNGHQPQNTGPQADAPSDASADE